MVHMVLRKWGVLFVCGLVLMPCSITLTLPFSFPGTAYAEYTLRQIIEGETCARDCWQDIEPGVSTLSEVDALLRNIHTHPYIVRYMESLSPMTYSWEYPETILFPDDTEYLRHVMTSFSERGIVLRVIIRSDLCLATVVDEYGVPDVILGDVYGYPRLVYAQDHLYFTTDEHGRIDSINKTIDENDMPPGTRLAWDDYSAENLDDLCIDGFSYQAAE